MNTYKKKKKKKLQFFRFFFNNPFSDRSSLTEATFFSAEGICLSVIAERTKSIVTISIDSGWIVETSGVWTTSQTNGWHRSAFSKHVEFSLEWCSKKYKKKQQPENRFSLIEIQLIIKIKIKKKIIKKVIIWTHFQKFNRLWRKIAGINFNGWIVL